jgi:hypothetical protein
VDTLTNTKIQYREPRENVSFGLHFVGPPTIEIKGTGDKKYTVEFWDGDVLTYRSDLSPNMWAKLNTLYFKPWTCKIFNGDELVYEHKLNLKNKKVYVINFTKCF